MRLRKSLLFALLFCFVLRLPLRSSAAAKDAPRSFSLSTIAHLCARREREDSALRAQCAGSRVSRLQGARRAEVFCRPQRPAQLWRAASQSPAEQIDQRTWIERLHDFKAHLWWLVRHFFRGQFTDEARDSFREEQGKLGKRSQVVGAARVRAGSAVEREPTGGALEAGNAAGPGERDAAVADRRPGRGRLPDRSHRRHLQGLHRRHRHQHRGGGADQWNGRPSLYVADRKTGAPVEQADVALWADGQLQSSGKTGGDGLASLTMNGARRRRREPEPENVWILARHGADAALVTPWGYGFEPSAAAISTRLYLHRSARLPAGPHGPHQGNRAQGRRRHAADLPDEQDRRH